VKEKMPLLKSIEDTLKIKDNDYSRLEPFTDGSVIPSSIIIPLYNNLAIVRKTLENISSHPQIRRNPGEFEVVMVNDGSSEDIDSIVEGMRFPCAVNYISYKENKGRSYARNQGIQGSSKDLLFFFDQDILLPEDYFVHMWKIHNSCKNILTVGLAENIHCENDRLDNVSAENISVDITDDFRYQKRFAKGKFDREEYSLINETDWFKRFGNNIQIGPWTLPKMSVTHNVAVRSENAKKVGGFDERFRTWGYEDTHFGAKLIASGCYLIPSKETGVVRILDGKKTEFNDKNSKIYESIIKTEYIDSD
jgi:glycosyltransferase involved in cell wall biosynthesis